MSTITPYTYKSLFQEGDVVVVVPLHPSRDQPVVGRVLARILFADDIGVALCSVAEDPSDYRANPSSYYRKRPTPESAQFVTWASIASICVHTPAREYEESWREYAIADIAWADYHADINEPEPNIAYHDLMKWSRNSVGAPLLEAARNALVSRGSQGCLEYHDLFLNADEDLEEVQPL